MIRITRKNLFSLLFVIAGLILSVGVVYAALSTSLNISGTTSVTGGGWNFKVSSVGTNFSAKKTGRASYTLPTISGTSLINYGATFVMPGDSVSFSFKLENIGNISGIIDSILYGTPKCTSSTGNTSDANLICNNLEYSLTYLNGDQVNVNDIIYNSNECFSMYPYYKEFIFTVSLNDELTTLPSSTVTVSNGTVSLNVVQSNVYATCGGGSND